MWRHATEASSTGSAPMHERPYLHIPQQDFGVSVALFDGTYITNLRWEMWILSELLTM